MYKTFGTEVLLAEDLNDIMRQTIIRVPDAAALAALPPLDAGTVAYNEADKAYYRRTATTWAKWLYDTGWVKPVGSPGGYNNTNNSVRVKDGIATINLYLTAASNRPAETIIGALPADAAWAHTIPDDVWFGALVNGNTVCRARVFAGGNINIYGAPTVPSGGTIRGTVTYPVG